MKKIVYATIAFSFLLAACGRRNIPSKSTTKKVLHPKITPDRIDNKQYVKRATIIDSTKVHGMDKVTKDKDVVDSYAPPAVTADSINTAPASVPVMDAPVIVIDSRGKLLIDTLNLPPTVSHNLDSINSATRAFTPNEAKNLAYRFKTIPPRVLFVPDNLAKKGRKGYYYKYNNKFWYWKRADGFYYLDENYYK